MDFSISSPVYNTTASKLDIPWMFGNLEVRELQCLTTGSKFAF